MCVCVCVCVFCFKVQYDVSMLVLVKADGSVQLDTVSHVGSKLFKPDITQSLLKLNNGGSF